ncbi:hypothetical protein BJV78DRAFT_1354535 [Lactifluus subvellereus]|nr:hypothetical protein BJV78DRAFT_1354535 [Lactifluus subvellereus]
MDFNVAREVITGKGVDSNRDELQRIKGRMDDREYKLRSPRPLRGAWVMSCSLERADLLGATRIKEAGVRDGLHVNVVSALAPGPAYCHWQSPTLLNLEMEEDRMEGIKTRLSQCAGATDAGYLVLKRSQGNAMNTMTDSSVKILYYMTDVGGFGPVPVVALESVSPVPQLHVNEGTPLLSECIDILPKVRAILCAADIDPHYPTYFPTRHSSGFRRFPPHPHTRVRTLPSSSVNTPESGAETWLRSLHRDGPLSPPIWCCTTFYCPHTCPPSPVRTLKVLEDTQYIRPGPITPFSAFSRPFVRHAYRFPLLRPSKRWTEDTKTQPNAADTRDAEYLVLKGLRIANDIIICTE